MFVIFLEPCISIRLCSVKRSIAKLFSKTLILFFSSTALTKACSISCPVKSLACRIQAIECSPSRAKSKLFPFFVNYMSIFIKSLIRLGPSFTIDSTTASLHNPAHAIKASLMCFSKESF